MLIKNWELLESIENAISEYNNELWRKEDQDKKLPYFEYEEDGESANVSEEILSKIKNLNVKVRSDQVDKDEMKYILNELSQMLDVMNLTSFRFSTLSRGKQFTQIDLSLLKHLNDDIENVAITGVDFSKEKPSILKRFKNVSRFSLQKCNISDPRIISELNPEILISLEQNEIAPEHYKDALQLIQRSNGRIRFTDTELTKVAEIYSTKKAELSDYMRLMDIVDFDSIPTLTIQVENEFDFENSNIEEIIKILNEKTNINLSMTRTDLSILDSNGCLKVPTKVVIKNASELNQEDITNHKSISKVQIIDGKNTETQQSEPYTREEYEMIREEIDKIISQIEFSEQNDPNREKKIFSQIYRMLGKKISYDDEAISEEKKDDKRLQVTCRNLLGGLLENKCVCAGYADILRNVLACTGIYAEYVAGMPDIENGIPINLKDPGGHAWNLVDLDGTKYWTDLTWDCNNIKSDRYPLPYCLKSTKDFKHSMFKKRLQDEKNDECLESISNGEQVMLFTGKKIEDRDETQQKETENTNYLSDFVLSAANSGLTVSNIRQVANKINEDQSVSIIQETEEEELDERY